MLRVDPATGATALDHERTDPAWVDIVPGVPAHTAAGALVTVADADGARRLVVDGVPVTPPSLQVRGVLDVEGDTVLIRAGETPESVGLWTWGPDGLVARTPGDGVYAGRLRGGTLAVARQDLDVDGTVTTVERGGSVSDDHVATPRPPAWSRGSRCSARAPVACRPRCCCRPGTGPARGCRCSWTPTAGRTPSASSPPEAPTSPASGSPSRGSPSSSSTGGARRGSARSSSAPCTATSPRPCWRTRSTRCTRWPREHPDLDLSRVGIRGWSFGGYLAALAVLRRPDVFHAAVAGAPVTDWALYDTHYTERYLGRPDTDPEAYARSSLMADAEKLERPLLLVHGLADDNVVVAHTLRLSSALLAAGRPHSVLPLSGVTHMTPQEVVAENLLLLQVRFLNDALGLTQTASGMWSGGPQGVSPRRLPARHSPTATASATTIDTTAAARVTAAACG